MVAQPNPRVHSVCRPVQNPKQSESMQFTQTKTTTANEVSPIGQEQRGVDPRHLLGLGSSIPAGDFGLVFRNGNSFRVVETLETELGGSEVEAGSRRLEILGGRLKNFEGSGSGRTATYRAEVTQRQLSLFGSQVRADALQMEQVLAKDALHNRRLSNASKTARFVFIVCSFMARGTTLVVRQCRQHRVRLQRDRATAHSTSKRL
mmetsp:Transcript_2873/g.3937  ORF Transcript_2873/g.3937 Transcript_2873/m.3937 type:complete len:205 (+) Transcript_2873:309-923(+)